MSEALIWDPLFNVRGPGRTSRNTIWRSGSWWWWWWWCRCPWNHLIFFIIFFRATLIVLYMILHLIRIIIIVVVIIIMILSAAALTVVVNTSVANGDGGYKLGSGSVPSRQRLTNMAEKNPGMFGDEEVCTVNLSIAFPTEAGLIRFTRQLRRTVTEITLPHLNLKLYCFLPLLLWPHQRPDIINWFVNKNKLWRSGKLLM